MSAMFLLTATTWIVRWRWGRWVFLRVLGPLLFRGLLFRVLTTQAARARFLREFRTPSTCPGSRLRKGDVVAGETESFLVDCRGLGYVLLAYDGILEAHVDPKKTYRRELPTRKERELWESMGLQVGSGP
jgi:hypothetical protein